MNLQLSERRIRETCREILKKRGQISGRAFREELRARFGAVGKTARIYQVWREESAQLDAEQLPGELILLRQRVHAAEAAAAENLKRAELAEFRERAHQDHWAMEIDRLKQELEAHRNAAGQGASRPFRV